MNPTVGWFWLRPCSLLCILPLARSLLCYEGPLVRTFTLVALHSAVRPAGSLQRHRIWNLEGAGAGVPWGVEIDPRACAAGRGGVRFLWFGLWHGARPFRQGVGERPQGKGERRTIRGVRGPGRPSWSAGARVGVEAEGAGWFMRLGGLARGSKMVRFPCVSASPCALIWSGALMFLPFLRRALAGLCC